MTGQITDPMLDRVAVTQINVARLLGSPDVLVRFRCDQGIARGCGRGNLVSSAVSVGSREPGAPAASAPTQATASLQLTPQQANDLILLLAHALGRKDTGIPDAPMPRLN